uniref:E3 UFM1-protein ligase 1 homolog n=1 Tax=Lotharella globosa TaxID=91324 RepID=A0A7S3YSF1_9EUKA|mmetsp:Transcript_2540/g.4993  ORF Transcript_2540/g.4993 Transcript_2540/m.4993 type:complete len:915 (+) Transcript_2540:60-2804(+)
MEEILALQKELMAAQMKDASHRLSHRNCVSLILKMISRGDIELLYTSSGREYLTHKQLDVEIREVIERNGGRISVLEIQQNCDVGIDYVKEKVNAMVKSDTDKRLLCGDVITERYLNDIAEEINEKLQNQGQVDIASLSQDFDLPASFIRDHVQAHLGTSIEGKLQGTHLYTRAYSDRLKAQIRGALHACTCPVAVNTITKTIQCDTQMAYSEVKRMVKEGELPGKLSGGSSMAIYTPSIFKAHQKMQLEQTWDKDGFITFDHLKKLQIPDPKRYLKTKYPKAMMLPSCCVGEHFVQQIHSAIKAAIDKKEYTNVEETVSLPISGDDFEYLLSKCLEKACSSKEPEVVQMCSTYAVSRDFLAQQTDKFKEFVEEKAKTLHASAMEEAETEEQVRDAGDAGDTRQRGAGGASESNARGSKGGKKSKGGKGERGQMKREKKMKSKKSKKGKGKGQAAPVQDDEPPPPSQESSFRSSKRRGKKGSGPSQGTSNNERRGRKPKKAPPAVVATSEVLDVLTKTWSGRLDAQFLREVASAIRPRVNAMLRAALQKLRTAGNQKGLQDQITNALQEVSDHIGVYHQTINNLRGKNEANLESDSELVELLQEYLCRSLGNQALDILLNSELIFSQLQIPGFEDAKEEKNNFAKSRSLAERMWILENAVKRNDTKKALKGFMNMLKTRNTEDVLESLHMAATVCSLRIRKIDNKKMRNLVFGIRRSMMSNLATEKNPRVVFQYVVLILHSQMASGLIHIPSKIINRILYLFDGKLKPDILGFMKRYHELLTSLGDAVLQTTKEDTKEAKGDELDMSNASGKLKKLRKVAKKYGITAETIKLLLEEDMDDDDLEEMGQDDLVDDMGIPTKQAELVIKAMSDDGTEEVKPDSKEDDRKSAEMTELLSLTDILKKAAATPKDALLE